MAVATVLMLPLLAGSALAAEPETACPDLKGSRQEIAASLDTTYVVDGVAVEHLRGKVKQGSTVQVRVTIPEGCDPVELTLASYESPEPAFHEDQVLYQYQSASYSGTAELVVEVPDCYFQLDLAHGPVIDSFADGARYGNRLIDAVNGGTNACASESPSPSDTPTTSETPSLPAESPGVSETPTHTPSPTESASAPTETPDGTETESETTAPAPPSDDEDAVGGADDDDNEVVRTAPRSTLASTGIPVLALALLALLGMGLGSTLLHTTRRRRAD